MLIMLPGAMLSSRYSCFLSNMENSKVLRPWEILWFKENWAWKRTPIVLGKGIRYLIDLPHTRCTAASILELNELGALSRTSFQPKFSVIDGQSVHHIYINSFKIVKYMLDFTFAIFNINLICLWFDNEGRMLMENCVPKILGQN